MDELYDGLSRYQWWLRRLSRLRPGARGAIGLEMHKRLRRGAATGLPEAGCAPLNDWLWGLVEPYLPAGPVRVLDVGCGFGATVFAWAPRAAERAGGDLLGLTVSPYQTRKATAEARRRGLAGSCAFRTRSFDDPGSGRAAGPFDVIVSIESLFHAPDLAGTLRRLAAAARPGGVLVLVEDMAVAASVREAAAAVDLLRHWSTDALATVEDYHRGLRAAGFVLRQDIDLTPQVDLPAADRDGRERRLRLLRRVLPVGRSVVDAFLGGIAMERLYGSDRLCYRAMLATRTERDP